MSKAFAALGVLLFAVALGTRALAAPSAVSTILLLHGHLPDLGGTPTLRVFQSADAYDAFHRSLGGADVFPAASSLTMSFDRYALALYGRGADSGDRCLTTNGAARVNGDAIELALAWQDGTCGAPAGARYPFILVGLSRNGNDGAPWLGVLRSVCAAAPGVDGSRACASVAVAGGTASAAPKTVAPSAQAASGAPAPSAVAAATSRSDPAPAAGFAIASAQAVGLVGIGLVLGVVLALAYTRWRRSHGARTGLTHERTTVTSESTGLASEP